MKHSVNYMLALIAFLFCVLVLNNAVFGEKFLTTREFNEDFGMALTMWFRPPEDPYSIWGGHFQKALRDGVHP